MPHRKQTLRENKKRLEDAIHRNGGKVCTTVFKETTHFVTTSYEVQHMKGVIDEIIGGAKIPIVNEDYIWSSIGNVEEEEHSDESQYESSPRPLDSADSLYDAHHEGDAAESEQNAAWANGRKLSSEVSRDQASYKYTPGGEFNYLAHYIYRQRDTNYMDAETSGAMDLDLFHFDQDEGEEDDEIALSFNVPLHDENIDTGSMGNNFPKDFEEFYAGNCERIEWQRMLASVLTGENRIYKTIHAHRQETDHYQRWLGIRAALSNRSLDEEKAALEKDRLHVDGIIEEVISFCYDSSKTSAIDQVSELLRKVDWIESLYPSRKVMTREKPSYGTEEFNYVLDALTSWSTVTHSLQTQLTILKNWTGSDTLMITNSGNIECGSASFIERILKENSLQRTFEKRTLSTLKSLLLKVKQDTIENSAAYSKVNLSRHVSELEQLVAFPTNLVGECLKLRLEYASRISKPTPVVVDQLQDDFRQSLSLACRIKEEYEVITRPAAGWEVSSCINQDFDAVLFSSLQFYFKLLNWRIKFHNKGTNVKEVEVLESEWAFLSNLTHTIEHSEQEVAEQFCSLTSKMLGRSLVNFSAQLREVGDDRVRHFARLLESFRLRVRKQMRFASTLTSQFENASEYALDGFQPLDAICELLARDHVLVTTGDAGLKGVALFLSPSLAQRIHSVSQILNSGFMRDDDCDGLEPGYVLVLSSRHKFHWTGRTVEHPVEPPFMDLKLNRVRLISNAPSTLLKNKYRFQALLGEAGLLVAQPRRANLPRIHRELSKIRRMSFRMARCILDSVGVVREATRAQPSVDLVETCFTFASEFGQRVMKTMDIPMRAKLTLRLIRLAIDWVNFVFNDCVPTDRKTFRWAVVALEFAMLMTSGNNIVLLAEDDFEELRSNVAGCMTLLISHFDIQGARGDHQAQPSAQVPLAPALPAAYAPQVEHGARADMLQRLEQLEVESNARQAAMGIAGRVLDANRPEDRTLGFLAASSSNFVMRWQQGKFLGAGTFGTVYLAVNLDSGDLMAVKEFRFPDPAQLLSLYKSIKEEMSVMQILHHPNIVNYFGIEVHRDRVFIFMEYCQGGSLASQLEHGRIEDENVVKIYTFQMLQGLEYLHDKGVLHRDIKPDNLLLDHIGVIKFVDFGASKVIAQNRTLAKSTKAGVNKSLTGTPMYMAPEVITGGNRGTQGAQDIWSLGCCVLEMVTGKRPWSNLDNEWAIMYHVASGHPPLPDPSQISPQARAASSAKTLLAHPWFKDMDMNLRPAAANSVASHLCYSSYTAGSSPVGTHHTNASFPLPAKPAATPTPLAEIDWSEGRSLEPGSPSPAASPVGSSGLASQALSPTLPPLNTPRTLASPSMSESGPEAGPPRSGRPTDSSVFSSPPTSP
ncbi:Suppressor of Sensor Kinase (SLN1) [Massospora cicadina]|nr:Suppressor of Sensor Kinase (SLN1) [Massospora cicadina]